MSRLKLLHTPVQGDSSFDWRYLQYLQGLDLCDPPGEHIIDEPFAIDLPKSRAANQARSEQHLVRWLKNSLKVRRIALCER